MSPSVRLRRVGLIAVALSSVFLLSACNPSGKPPRDFPGVPVEEDAAPVDVDPESGGEIEDPAEGETEGSEFVESDGPQVAWFEEGGRSPSSCTAAPPARTVGGRSACSRRPARATASRSTSCSARDEICTADFVPHTTVFWTPVDVTTTDLMVEVAGSEVQVPIK